MMPAALNYGPMQRPDEKSSIKASLDPVSAIMAAYEQWQTLAEGVGFSVHRIGDRFDFDKADSLFSEAASLLSQQQQPLQGLDARLLDSVAHQITPTDASGLFLSALHNLSGVEEFRLSASHPVIGYRLLQGKRLVIGPDVTAFYAGHTSAGEIVNYGDVERLCWMSLQGALGVNYYALIGDFGAQSRGASLFNFGGCIYMGSGAHDSNIINYGEADTIQSSERGTLSINLGKVVSSLHYNMPPLHPTQRMSAYRRSACINLGTVKGSGVIYGGIDDSEDQLQLFGDVTPAHEEAGDQLKQIIAASFAPLNNAATLDDKLAAMSQMDWKTLRDKITAVGDQMREK